MAEEEDKGASSEGEETKKKKPILLILVGVVLVGGAAAAGTLLGPKLMGAPAPEPAAAPPEATEAVQAEGDIVTDTVSFAPFIVDTRDAEGITHHIKVAVSIELTEGTEDAAFRPYVPRGREVAIAYLRSQKFEELTDPGRFEEIRKELSQRIIEAVGEQRAGRVLITDFVAQ